MPATKYIAYLNGKIVGTRTSAAKRVYTHAIVANGHARVDQVVAWSGSLRLAQVQQRNWERYGYRIDIVEAQVIQPKAKVEPSSERLAQAFNDSGVFAPFTCKAK